MWFAAWRLGMQAGSPAIDKNGVCKMVGVGRPWSVLLQIAIGVGGPTCAWLAVG